MIGGVRPEEDPPLEHAWVDESVLGWTPLLGGGLYVLAATVADPTVCEAARESLRHLLLGKSRRLHWTHESRDRRELIAETIAALSVTTTVVIGAPIDHRRQERARRLCMERLVYELEILGVSQLWIESRHDALNRRDQKMIDALRQRGTLSPKTSVGFARPYEEPMLWIPDAVAGAVGGARRGDTGRPREILDRVVREVEITLA